MVEGLNRIAIYLMSRIRTAYSHKVSVLGRDMGYDIPLAFTSPLATDQHIDDPIY